MVVLITGANGQVGQALQSIAPDYPDLDFRFFNSQQLDITDRSNVANTLADIKPDFILNTAAYTAVDKAESEPEKAHLVNVDGPKNLALAAKKIGAILVHISTDFVFDGTKRTPYLETDKPNPAGVYGQTKLDGELAIQAVYDRYFIVRTSWVYSQFGHNFMKTMLRLASERDRLTVVNDQVGCPTHAVDLARALAQMIVFCQKNPENPPFGIYNFSNAGACSWFDFAKKIFESHKITLDLQPIPTSAYPTPAKRPAYSVLDTSKVTETFGVKSRSWEQSLLETIQSQPVDE